MLTHQLWNTIDCVKQWCNAFVLLSNKMNYLLIDAITVCSFAHSRKAWETSLHFGHSRKTRVHTAKTSFHFGHLFDAFNFWSFAHSRNAWKRSIHFGQTRNTCMHTGKTTINFGHLRNFRRLAIYIHLLTLIIV